MRKFAFAAAILAILAGCAGDGGFMAPRSTAQELDQRFWPPPVEGQAWPPQHMWSD